MIDEKMSQIALFLLLLLAMPTWAHTACLYDEHNRRTDRIEYESRFTADRAAPNEYHVQMKDVQTGKILLPLSANYTESFWFFNSHPEKACFSHRTWLRNNRTNKIEAFDAKGNYLGYEPMTTGDGYLVDESDDGFLPIRNGNKFGFADVKTGQLRIYPQYFAVNPFENGRAKVSYSGVVKSHSNTDWIPVYLSDQWFYIDQQGNRLPESAPQDDLNQPNLYSQHDMVGEGWRQRLLWGDWGKHIRHFWAEK